MGFSHLPTGECLLGRVAGAVNRKSRTGGAGDDGNGQHASRIGVDDGVVQQDIEGRAHRVGIAAGRVRSGRGAVSVPPFPEIGITGALEGVPDVLNAGAEPVARSARGPFVPGIENVAESGAHVAFHPFAGLVPAAHSVVPRLQAGAASARVVSDGTVVRGVGLAVILFVAIPQPEVGPALGERASGAAGPLHEMRGGTVASGHFLANPAQRLNITACPYS